MSNYLPPRQAFDSRDLAVMKRAFDSAWTEIRASNLIDLAKDDALKRALCQKLFSLVRTRPTEAETLRDMLLSSVSADAGDDPSPELSF